MQELAWLAETIRVWLEGGTMAELKATPGFVMLVMLAAGLIPPTLILIGIDGLSEWRRTPLAAWFGVDPTDPDEDWTTHARDLNKDGLPDF